MFFVQCPHCGSIVEIPADAVGTERTDLWNVTGCGDCDVIFDYNDEEVQFTSDAEGVL